MATNISGSALTFTGSIARQAKGRNPCLCVNDDGMIVELHQPSRSSRLHYHVGKLMDNFTVRWSEETDLDDGAYPSVSLNCRNIVVVVYERPLVRKIRCRVGKLDPVAETIKWFEMVDLAWGRYPKVVLNNKGQAVIVYEAAVAYGTFYRTGNVSTDGMSIVWCEEERKLFTMGANELSLTMNQSGHVVVAGRVSGHKIQFCVGELQEEVQSQNQSLSGPSPSSSTPEPTISGYTISWGTFKAFDMSSSHPSVSINNEQHIVVALQNKSGGGLSYRLGMFDRDKTITWEHASRNYDRGINPTIALCNDGRFIEEHEGNEYALQGHMLFYRVGTLHTKAAVHVEPDEESHQE